MDIDWTLALTIVASILIAKFIGALLDFSGNDTERHQQLINELDEIRGYLADTQRSIEHIESSSASTAMNTYRGD